MTFKKTNIINKETCFLQAFLFRKNKNYKNNGKFKKYAKKEFVSKKIKN